MEETKPRRRNRRVLWIIAGGSAALAGIATIGGPLRYAYVRGWLPMGTQSFVYATGNLPVIGPALRLYYRWWDDQAYRAIGYEVWEWPDGSHWYHDPQYPQHTAPGARQLDLD
jgi:hypothetical protein